MSMRELIIFFFIFFFFKGIFAVILEVKVQMVNAGRDMDSNFAVI